MWILRKFAFLFSIEMLNVGLVYDLIAKIWAETDPVYDLPAIDNGPGIFTREKSPSPPADQQKSYVAQPV